MCGLSCVLREETFKSPDDTDQSYKAVGGIIDAEIIGGYDSTPGNGYGALDDMCGYRFSMCEWCLDWLFQQFNTPPTTFDPMNRFVLKAGETVDEGLNRMGVVRVMGRVPEPEPFKPAVQRVNEDEYRTDRTTFFTELARRDAARKKDITR